MKKIFNILAFLGLSLTSQLAYAEYSVYLMNNAPQNLYVNNVCDGNQDSNGCVTLDFEMQFPEFSRYKVFNINYNKGMKSGKTYTLKSYFNFAGQQSRDNYISITFRGDTIGSYIQSIDAYVNGSWHNLLDSNNSKGKVLPEQLGEFSFTDNKGDLYKIYATAQHDSLTSVQGIDSIYLTLDKSANHFVADNDPKSLTVMSYNIQAFPNYIGVGLDLNKMDTRMDYLSTMYAPIRDFDVIAFQEAWDRDSREKIKRNLAAYYPYSLDPVPDNTHSLPLNSGLLVLSKYPISNSKFLNYVDYQSLTDADKLSNKGALYFKLNKLGKNYNMIVTHTQAQNTAQAIKVRQEEFNLIQNQLINNPDLNIAHDEPLLFFGDLNTDHYDEQQFSYMQRTLNLNDQWLSNTLYKTPKFSYDSTLNLMIDSSVNEQGTYDYIIPVNGYAQPEKVDYQITPVRAVDYARMYRRSLNTKLYNYGDVEISDHFMVQGKFFFPN